MILISSNLFASFRLLTFNSNNDIIYTQQGRIKKSAIRNGRMIIKMKLRKLAIFTAAALTVSSAMIGASAKDLELNAAYSTPEIDGRMDEAYKNSSVYEVKYCTDESYSTSKLYYLWDESALYIFAEVTDNTPSTKADTTNLGDIWKTDCIEFGVNLIPDEKGDPHKISKGGVWLAAPMYDTQLDIYGALNSIESVKNGNKCVTTETDTGWTVEVMFPIFGDDSGVTPKAGDKFGVYAITHNDTNDDNARDTITWHNSDFTGANYDSSLMDYIVLAEKPAEPVNTAPQTSDLSVIALLGSAAAAFVGIKAKRK